MIGIFLIAIAIAYWVDYRKKPKEFFTPVFGLSTFLLITGVLGIIIYVIINSFF